MKFEKTVEAVGFFESFRSDSLPVSKMMYNFFFLPFKCTLVHAYANFTAFRLDRDNIDTRIINHWRRHCYHCY